MKLNETKTKNNKQKKEQQMKNYKEVESKLQKYIDCKLWQSGEKSRLYFNEKLFNSNKCKQTAYIDLCALTLTVFTDCPSQTWTWIESQNNVLKNKLELFRRYSSLILFGQKNEN